MLGWLEKIKQVFIFADMDLEMEEENAEDMEEENVEQKLNDMSNVVDLSEHKYKNIPIEFRRRYANEVIEALEDLFGCDTLYIRTTTDSIVIDDPPNPNEILIYIAKPTAERYNQYICHKVKSKGE